MNGKLVYLIITTCCVVSSSAVNILLLEEMATSSHHTCFRSVSEALASKGYKVTVASPFYDVSSTNLHNIHMEKVLEKVYENIKNNIIVESGHRNVVASSTVNILLLEEIASPSHHFWFRSVTKALASKGYNVTVATPDHDVSSTNIHYIHMKKVYDILALHTEDRSANYLIEIGNLNVLRQLLEFSKYSTGHFKSDGWKTLDNYPNDFKFDLIIHDYVMGGCLISFANKFQNVPLIAMTALSDNFALTNYIQSSVVSSLSPYPFYNHNPKTFLQQALNFVMHIADKITFNYYTIPKITAAIRELSSFKDTPSTLELGRRSIVYLTNYDPSVDGLQQLPTNVISVGGLQINAPSPLPENLQSLADNAKNGLVLFSLGTNVQTEMLGEQRIIAILEAFQKLPKYTFLWKTNMEKFPIALPTNVVIQKWVPQNDILGHKNTKLFITHAGLLSTQESIFHGVPMLGVPIFADQFIVNDRMSNFAPVYKDFLFQNIRRSVEKGFAEVLYVNDLTTENLHNKVKVLLTESKYRDQIKLASAAFQDQKETPLERAIWWIDWVMRNPNSNHFKSPGSDLNFLQLESVDVILFTAVTVFLSIYGFVWFFKLYWKCRFGDRKTDYGKRKNE